MACGRTAARALENGGRRFALRHQLGGEAKGHDGNDCYSDD
jgi:hypothetical protein